MEAEIRWLASVLMLVMVSSLLFTIIVVVRRFWTPAVIPRPRWEKLVIPLLALGGMSLASSLSSIQAQAGGVNRYAETSCLAVLNSPYAKLFDVFPVSVLGRQAYTVVFWASTWALARSHKPTYMVYRGILALTIAGTFFSLYLTYLEAFVIRVACLQCLLSAIGMTLLMLIVLAPALEGTCCSKNTAMLEARQRKGLFRLARCKPYRPK